MDYNDMAESLRKKKFNEPVVEFQSLPNNHHWESEDLVAAPPSGSRPRVAKFVDIAKSMSQGSVGIVRQM